MTILCFVLSSSTYLFGFKIEELVLQRWIENLEPTAIVQRITYSIPTTTSRGVMFQQSAAYFAIQHLMNLEEVDLPGRVSVTKIKLGLIFDLRSIILIGERRKSIG